MDFKCSLNEAYKMLLKNIMKNGKPRQNIKLGLTQDEYNTYRNTGNYVIELVCSDATLLQFQNEGRIKRFFNYSSDYMYHIGGGIIASVFKVLVPDADKESTQLSYVAGWCCELLSASLLASDNIMDNNSERGLRPTWHSTEGVEAAVLDLYIAEQTVLIAIEKFFRDKPYLPELLYHFQNGVQCFYFGQVIDGCTPCDSYELNKQRFLNFARAHFGACAYETPFQIALVMAGERCAETWEFVHQVSRLLGELARAQNDYRDLAVDVKRGEKAGMDIPNGKNNWTYLTAVKKANEEEQKIISENYGKEDAGCIARILQLYEKLDVVGEYFRYEEIMVKKIRDLNSNSGGKIPKYMVEQLLSCILRKELY